MKMETPFTTKKKHFLEIAEFPAVVTEWQWRAPGAGPHGFYIVIASDLQQIVNIYINNSIIS